MLGEIGGVEVEPNLNRGIIPRIFEFLFARIKVVKYQKWVNAISFGVFKSLVINFLFIFSLAGGRKQEG